MKPANNLTRAEAQGRAAAISDISYEVDLDLTGGEENFACETTIRFAAAPGASTFLDYFAPAVERVEVNGRQVDVSFDGARIRLEGLEAHNEVRVLGTSAYENTGAGLHRFRDPVDGHVY